MLGKLNYLYMESQQQTTHEIVLELPRNEGGL